MLRPHIALTILCMALLAFGCSAAGPDVTGKWQEVGEPEETLEIFADGRVSISDQDSTITGHWEPASDGTIKIEANIFGMSAEMTGRLEGESFHLQADGQTTTYRRMP